MGVRSSLNVEGYGTLYNYRVYTISTIEVCVVD